MAVTKPFSTYIAGKSLGSASSFMGLDASNGVVRQTLDSALSGAPAATDGVPDLLGVTADGTVVKSPGVLNALTVKDADGATQFRVENNLNAVNNFLITGGISGSGPVMAVEGTDTNIDSFWAAKGTGAVVLGNGGGSVLSVGSGAVNPYTNDGASLGTGSRWWSDLFLATGAVINYGNGNVTVTHSSSVLTVAGHLVSTESFKAPNFFLDGAAGTNRLIYGRTGTSTRWQVGVNSTAESGSDAGSEWTGLYYSDAGAFKGTAWSVDRNGNFKMPRPALDAGGESTAANIANIAHAINTTGKTRGLLVWDTTNNRMMRAAGSAASSVWWVVDGSASVTPA